MQGYKDIGAILARAREEHVLSVADVAKQLHIRPRYIVALEEGNITLMPNLAYVKGYLKRYALYLSLDQTEIMRRFEMASAEQGNTPFFMPHTFSREKRVHPNTVVVSLIGIAIFFILWATLFRAEHSEISIVEPVPEKVMVQETAPPLPENITLTPCLRPSKSVYPPCYWPEPEPTRSMLYQLEP